MGQIEKFRLIGPMTLDRSLRQQNIEIALGVWGSDLWEEGLIDFTDHLIGGTNIYAKDLVDDFYQYWEHTRKLTRCEYGEPHVSEGECFVDVAEGDVPFVVSVYVAGLPEAFGAKLWVKRDIVQVRLNSDKTSWVVYPPEPGWTTYIGNTEDVTCVRNRHEYS